MVGGQVLDLIFENKKVSLSDVEKIHKNKTAKLISASCFSGAVIATDDDEKIDKIRNFGELIGLAFQIIDDILDITGDDKVLGKKTGSDIEKGKATYPQVAGIDKSRDIAKNLIEQAVKNIQFLEEKGKILTLIAKYFLTRIN